MTFSSLIPWLAGAACACLLPLPGRDPGDRPFPEPGPLSKSSVPLPGTVSSLPPSGGSSHEEKEENNNLPQTLADIEGLSPAATLQAYDDLIAQCHSRRPGLQREQILTSLVLRLFRSEKNGTDQPAFPAGRLLPAWLLAPAWLTLAKEPGGIPDSLRLALPGQPAGLEAAQTIAGSLATQQDASAARSFAALMPPDWRPALNRAALTHLAGTRPLEALRQAPSDDRILLEQLTMLAARTGPVEETAEMLLERGEDSGSFLFKYPLSLLFARDRPGLEKWAASRSDARLQVALEELKNRPDLRSLAGQSFQEVLATASRAEDPKKYQVAAMTSLFHTATEDPGAAIQAWTAMEEGDLKSQLMFHLMESLGRHHPAEGFAWSRTRQPAQMERALSHWMQRDAPAALRALLDLPYSDPFRQRAVDQIQSSDPVTVFGSSVDRSDIESALPDLPPDLQRQLLPVP